MKLNLGAGKDYKEGWTNVDIVKTFPTDVIADLRNSFPFRDASIEEILASDILEHFTKGEGEKFLQESYRILQENGFITIRTHNIYQIFKQFKNDPEVLVHFLYGDTKETGEFGAHKFAYTKNSLSHLLRKIGFEIVSFENETTNFLVKAKKRGQKNKKLHIGIIQQSPDIGGAETYMSSLLKNFQKLESTITIASDSNKFLSLTKAYCARQIKIPFTLDIIGDWKGCVKTIFKLPFAFLFYNKLLLNFKQSKVSVVLMSGFSEKMLVTFLAEFYAIPLVWIEYSPLDIVFKRNFYLPKIIYRLLGTKPYAIIVPTELTKKALMRSARVSQNKLQVIPCGTTIPHSTIKAKILFPQNSFVIGSVSRLTKEKGQHILIQAMPAILKKIPQAKLLIVGDGPDKDYYYKLINKLNLSNNILITGFVDNLEDYWHEMDMFIFPSIWNLEGFGLVTIEAMARKIPVIANKIGPTQEIVDNLQTGLLIDITDQKILVETIDNLYKNKNLQEKIILNAYKKVKKKYNITKVSQEILGVLFDATI